MYRKDRQSRTRHGLLPRSKEVDSSACSESAAFWSKFAEELGGLVGRQLAKTTLARLAAPDTETPALTSQKGL